MEVLLLERSGAVLPPPGAPERAEAAGFKPPRFNVSVPSDPIVKYDKANLGLEFWHVACRTPGAPVVISHQESITYDWLSSAVGEVCRTLRSKPDFRPGTPIGLLAENSIEYLAGFYGILLADGVVVPLPTRLERERWHPIQQACEFPYLVTGEVAGVRNRLLSGVPRRRLNLDLACDRMAAPEAFTMPMPERGGNDLAMILFTSGSTGEAKGVMLSHRNLLSNARSILNTLPIGADDRSLAVMPFCHALGNSVLQSHVLAGATLILGGQATFPVSLLETMRLLGATSLMAVPEVYSLLLRFTNLATERLPNLRYAGVAGGALKPELAREFAERIAPAPFFVMYGQSEATARLACLPPAELGKRAGSIGRAVPGVELKIADETGQPLPTGQTGILYARGDNIMLGYWRDPEGTSRVLRDGWLNTGDLARCDAEGYLYLQGRSNLLVKVQGHRFHPREVEDFLAQEFPGIQAAVVAFELDGQTRLALFAVPPPGRVMEVDALRTACLRELPRYKVPSHIEILSQLPLNSALKVDRQTLALRTPGSGRRAS